MGPSRRHARLRILAAIGGAVVLACMSPSTAHAATLGCSADARGTTDLSAWVPSMLAATNEHRASLGLPALQLDATLSKASQWKARDLAARDYFAHDDPANGSAPARSPWERLVDCGFTSGGSRAENIAAGQDSGAEFVAAWIASPGHRANIENGSLRYVGFGVASLESSTYDTYAVQMFSSLPGPVASTDPSPTTTTEQPRDPQEGGDAAATPRIVAGASVTRIRCRSRLAVAGWCYQLTVRGRLAASDVQAIASRRIVASRRVGTRRLAIVGRTSTRANGAFVTRRWLRPPARGTRTWLLRNAGVVRVGVARSGTSPGAAVVLRARVRV